MSTLSNDKQMKQKKFSDGLNNLFAGLLSREVTVSRQSPLYQLLMENPQLFESPSDFQYSLKRQLDKPIKQALKDTKETDSSEYAEIFMNHQFYENHIEKLCSKFEGDFACADKSSVILSGYLFYLRTGEKPTWNPDEEIERNNRKIKCYWLPRFGTQDQWYALLNGLYVFRYGSSEKYFYAYQSLLEEAKIKYLEN